MKPLSTKFYLQANPNQVLWLLEHYVVPKLCSLNVLEKVVSGKWFYSVFQIFVTFHFCGCNDLLCLFIADIWM